MKRGRLLRAALGCAGLLAAVPIADAQNSTGGVPAPLLAHFTRGANLTRWFGYVPASADAAYFQNYLTDADFAAFQRLQLGFVRLCVTPAVIYDHGQPKAAVLPSLDQALAHLTGANLAVILDLQDNGQLKLDAPNQDDSGFLTFWQAIATRYQGKYENLLVFELVNEPVFKKNPEVWYALQTRAVEAIRAIDPARAIMVSGTNYSSADELAQMTPLAEKNLIYTFHCYDPFYFTHQGAGWVGDKPKNFREVPFPASPEAVAGILAENQPQYQGDLEWYGRQGYDAAYLRGRLEKAMDWGRAHGVPVVLGEFGSYPKVAPPESRARWFAAMRAACAELLVPNSIWGYDDAMGLGRKIRGGALWLDPVTLQNFYQLPPAPSP
jgi:hypothetical protein